MTTTYLADLHILEDPLIFKKYYNALPTWRREKADRITPAKNKIQSVGAWSLYQAICNLLPNHSSAKFYKDEKDFIADTSINISHSGYFALCTISDDPSSKVGCDIETIGTFRESVARRCFCESEYQHIINIQDDRERTRLFYRYWVLKESFLKATRLGIRLDTTSFEIAWKYSISRETALGADSNSAKTTCCKLPYLLKKPNNFPESYLYQEYFLDSSVDKKSLHSLKHPLSTQSASTDATIAVCTNDPYIDQELHILQL